MTLEVRAVQNGKLGVSAVRVGTKGCLSLLRISVVGRNSKYIETDADPGANYIVGWIMK